MDSEVVNPYHEYRDVDREDTEHKKEDRMGVVVEIMIRSRSLAYRLARP